MNLNKIKILFSAIIGEVVKLRYRVCTPSFKHALNQDSLRQEKLIVSLTSYGRRVHDVLPFALYSLLSQRYKPDAIVVWLDETWNDDRLPRRIKKLQEEGVVKVCYCRDIRSYKKLIPALKAYPEDLIVTFDDDLYYRRDLLLRIMDAHLKYPDTVITHRAHRVGYTDDGIAKYDTWEQCISDKSGNDVFPTGGAGCLYKREWLHQDVAREDIFMKICPLADDVWFFFMELLKGTERRVLKRNKYVYIPLDDFYQYFHQHSSLASVNEQENMNDKQIKNVMDYYGLVARDICW